MHTLSTAAAVPWQLMLGGMPRVDQPAPETAAPAAHAQG